MYTYIIKEWKGRILNSKIRNSMNKWNDYINLISVLLLLCIAPLVTNWGFPGGAEVKNLPVNEGDLRDAGFYLWVGKIPWSRKWQPAPVLLSLRLHGQKSLVGYSPRGHKELDMTEHAYTHAWWQITKLPLPRPDSDSYLLKKVP